MDFPEHLAGVLRAAADRIIPRDEFPSASENGVIDYLRKQWGTTLRGEQEFLVRGLEQVDAEAVARLTRGFGELSELEQDALLADLEHGATITAWPVPAAKFFMRLVNLTAEGYYADPSNGGNREMASWKMVGFMP